LEEEKEEEEEAGKHALLINCGYDGTSFHALKYLSVGSTRARRSGYVGGSLK
jgi:hypothetical protein